jgi:hypothetical protein
MNSARHPIAAAAFAAALAILPLHEAWARGGFTGGGFKSAPSIRSFSSSKGISSWGSAIRPAGGPSAKASSSSSLPRFSGVSGTRAGLSAQRSLFESAKRSGTLFSSRDEAAQAFRSRYAKDYGTSFVSEPQSRPSYIPGYTLVGGRRSPIAYVPSLGGYGYMNALGAWVLYDALSDPIALDPLMARTNYYWGSPPIYLSHGFGFFRLARILFMLIIAAALFSRISRRRRRGPR